MCGGCSAVLYTHSTSNTKVYFNLSKELLMSCGDWCQVANFRQGKTNASFCIMDLKFQIINDIINTGIILI